MSCMIRSPCSFHRSRQRVHVKESPAQNKQLLGNSGSASPTVTAGGLVFVGATNDGRFRAFDAKTGKELWESRTDGQPLTTPGNSGSASANPMTYTSKSGKQFVGIVAGGNLRVFALP